MTIRTFLRHYLVSPLGIGVSLASLAAGAAPLLLGRPLLSLPALAGTWLLATTISFKLGLGARSVVSEQARAGWQAQAEGLEAVAAAARRLGSLRLADPELKRLASLAALQADRYYAACQRHKTIEPRASQAAVECLEVIDSALAGSDALCQGKHYGAGASPDGGDLAGGDLGARAAALLVERIKLMEHATLAIEGGLMPADRLAIKEELQS
ncbi:MAG: hypothetical protein A2087_14115 [Spirochaetes bacterium GWD1_61_31]|nr:MAG: hypothetical protein A2Y37_02065 [Spirochaetes bacterium GWB1_60_80]OHD33114.1 MAG: hypothetical protein A2004_12350 [Spirochaetes bacterium GWC1_61_12]OHD39580.1 MAG: hypothetical protein A2087_14115 [Spirochaetes bacterium GWD1_61_31]OHD43844.1 MAG: hypothetical protein A2Y35_00345 [Spirochaetes bacterium GWE1_60_18]OHD61168.1 MAG: hypothetical protein A2Y32_03625 [Spirochaetes bacterium GWF1_60_12]HAP44274.1 hypothetical protein [Spirochaetaceae bacterium]